MFSFALEKLNKYDFFLENLPNSKFNSATVSDILETNLSRKKSLFS